MAANASQVKARFKAEGITIAQWARQHGFSVVMVYRVLDGKVKGAWGDAYKIAVALGLKKRPPVTRFTEDTAA